MKNNLRVHADLTGQSLLLEGPNADRPMLADVRYRADGKAKPVLIFVHGFKGFKDWGAWHLMMNELALAGFVVLKANLSHNGTTPDSPLDFADLDAFGRNTYSRELEDVGVWLDAVAEGHPTLPATEMDPDRIGLIGHSRGGAIVLLKAAEDPRVKAVATWAAVADLSKRYSEAVVEKWEQEGVHYIPNARTGQQMPLYFTLIEDVRTHADRLSVPKQVPTLRMPLMVVHGDADPTVPMADAQAIKTLQPAAELVIVRGADHVFQMRHPWEKSTLPLEAMQAVTATQDFFIHTLA